MSQEYFTSYPKNKKLLKQQKKLQPQLKNLPLKLNKLNIDLHKKLEVKPVKDKVQNLVASRHQVEKERKLQMI